jgi:hypothetical protein
VIANASNRITKQKQNKDNIMANTHDRQEWQELTDEQFAQLNEQLPFGETTSIDDNYCECEEWTIGNHRCSCGNRRMAIGCDFLLGGDTYFYPEPY